MLEAFLNEKSPLQAGKIRAVLGKVFNFSSLGVMTLANAIEEYSQGEDFNIECYSVWGKKKNGERNLTKPKWGVSAVMSGHKSGPEVGRIGAEYANWLVGNKFDLEAIERRANEIYNKQ